MSTVKISVFLPEPLHQRAKIKAAKRRISLTKMVAALVEESLKRRPAKKEAA